MQKGISIRSPRWLAQMTPSVSRHASSSTVVTRMPCGQRSCSEPTSFPARKVKLESESLNCSRSPACGASATHSSGASKFKKRGLRKSRSAPRPKPAHPYGEHTTTQAHPCREYGGCLPHHYLAFQFL